MSSFKKILLILFVLILPSTSFSEGLNVFVSILPQKYFAQKIGKDKINVDVMVLPGHSPASYNPKPSQMAKLGKTDIFFYIGVPFEKVWLRKLKKNYKNVVFADTRKGCQTRHIEENLFKSDSHHHHDHDHGCDHEHHHGMLDPHIWMSPYNATKIANNILLTLQKKDPKNSKYYMENYNAFLKEIDELDKKLMSITKNSKGREVFVFHPSWGYFMDEYGFKQIAIESGGKEPSAKYLSKLINYAKENKVGILLVQPQFPSDSVKVMEKRLNLKVYVGDPLSVMWDENLINIAKVISE